MTRDRLYELLPGDLPHPRCRATAKPLEALLQIIGEQVDARRRRHRAAVRQLVHRDLRGLGRAVHRRARRLPSRAADSRASPLDGDQGSRAPPDPDSAPRGRQHDPLPTAQGHAGACSKLLANDVAGWPARAVEFLQLLGWHSGAQLPAPGPGRAPSTCARTAMLDLARQPVRPAGATRSTCVASTRARRVGRHNIPSVGVFVWRLRSYPVTQTPAVCVEKAGPHCFTFSVLGNDAPALSRSPSPKPIRRTSPSELNLPVPIRRGVLAEHRDRLVRRRTQSLFIWTGVKRGKTVSLEPVPADHIVAADLTGWTYLPRRGTVAVDPVLGRIAFPPQQPPKNGVWVSYRYGFSADMGGGEYDRPISQPTGSVTVCRQPGRHARHDRQGARSVANRAAPPRRHRDRRQPRLRRAHSDRVQCRVRRACRLRAANGRRPVIRLLDWQTSQPDALTVFGTRRQSLRAGRNAWSPGAASR